MSEPKPETTDWDRECVVCGYKWRGDENSRCPMRHNQTVDPEPIPMILHCPDCRARHVDNGLFAVKPHHTHACQSCGMVWRPAIVPTVGVKFLPGFKDANNVPQTTEALSRQSAIERWIGVIQIYLEACIKDAPTESCAVFARNLWDETAEFDGDVGISE